MEGEYTIVVLGIAATSAFTLTVEAYMVERELNPEETLALGSVRTQLCRLQPCCCPVRREPRHA